jgi:methionyl-tRNA formyltransferase
LSTLPWRIVFFGTPDFAVSTLKALLEGPDRVMAVVTQPDRGKGRGQRVIPSPVKKVALAHGIPSHQPDRVKDPSFQEEVKNLQPDLFVVVAYGQILPKSLLDIPKHGAINVHASLLPKYRGAAPISWALLKGEKVTGITTMMMDAGMDTGDILLQSEIPIGEGETFETLHDRLAELGAQLLKETIAGLESEKITPVSQDHSGATYAPLIKKEDGQIDWSKGADEIDRQVRAFNPWPGAYTQWEDRLLKIFGGEVRKGAPQGENGSVSWVGTDVIEVKAGKGCYGIRGVQLEGGKRLSVRDFLQGHRVQVGMVFK